MRRLLSLQRLIGDNDGVTAIEYGLIAALIAIAAIVAFTAVGTSLSNLFSLIASDLSGGCYAACPCGSRSARGPRQAMV